MMGISFNGSNILGTGKITWNPRPEVSFKYLILSESSILPAVSLGFESQGYGLYDDDLNLLWRIEPQHGPGRHAGVSYGIENKDNAGQGLPVMGRDKGYLNLGVRVTFGGFGLEFDLRNLLDNRTGSVSTSRELKDPVYRRF